MVYGYFILIRACMKRTCMRSLHRAAVKVQPFLVAPSITQNMPQESQTLWKVDQPNYQNSKQNLGEKGNLGTEAESPVHVSSTVKNTLTCSPHVEQQKASLPFLWFLQHSSAPDIFISKFKINTFMNNAIIMIVLMMISLILVSLNYTPCQIFHLLCWLS